MSEANKEVMYRIFDEVWNDRNLDAIDELFAPHYVSRGLPPTMSPDREGVRTLIGMYHNAFPDLYVEVEQMIAEGDMVATRFVAHGTHQAPFMHVPATGREIHVPVVVISRIQNGQNVEAWVQNDMFGLMVQLGVIQPPG